MDFTVEIAPENLRKLRELASADNNEDARMFVAEDAKDYIMEYLDSNGVPNTLLRIR